MAARKTHRSIDWHVKCAVFIISLAQASFGDPRYSVPEETKNKYVIGSLTKDLNLDSKLLAARKARVDNQGERRYCGIDLTTGDLIVLERIDREKLCGQTKADKPCILHFEFILENPLELYNIALEIDDINDNPPIFSKDLVKLEISETAPIGSRFQIPTARDLDVGINSVQNYILGKNEYFVLDVQNSRERGRYAEIVLKNALDREKVGEHTLLVTAVDGGSPSKSGSTTVHILVMDFNDNAPVFQQTVYKVNLLENAQPGTFIVKVSATDKDEGANGVVSYDFNHVSESSKRLFHIDSKSGELKVIDKIDYEEASSYEIEIQAEDGGGQTGHCKVLIQITDVNDNAPIITVKSSLNPIPENVPTGTEIAVINVKDLDDGVNSRVHCSLSENIHFELQSSIKNYFTLVTKALLDREEVSEFNVTVTATDGGSPPLSTDIVLNFKISDINDNPPTFDEQSYIAYVTENNKPGTSVISLRAGDPDWRQNGTVSYSLLSGQIGGVPVSSFLSINGDTGVIHAVRSFDYEQFRSFKVQVVARDNGSPPLSSNVTVSVFITDENDNSPQILYPAPLGKSFMTEMIPKAASAGSLVSKVIAVDADSGQNAWLSYQILKSTDPGLFKIGLHSGEIRTQRDISESDTMKQNIIISVRDNGQPFLSTTCSVHLLISDNLAEIPQLKDMSYEESNSKLTSYLIIALVSVSTFFLTFIILIVAVRLCRRRKPQLLFDGAVAVPGAYFPPNYADVDGAGTLRSSYNYDTYLTTGSRTSDFRFVRSYNDVTLPAEKTLKSPNGNSEEIDIAGNGSKCATLQKPPNTDWRFSQNQRPGTSGQHKYNTTQIRWTPYGKARAAPPPEAAVGTGPWPNPPTEAEQLQALMAAANEVSEATATLGPGTMGLSTRYSPQFTLQHVPDYRQNVYIPGSTATLTANQQQQQQQQQQPPQPALPQPPPQAEAPKAAQTPASKKKSAKKDKK
ncbi:protocadherin gamma-A9-like isoform X23 [Anguilla rostrata]|uniref:protocadherin gamma-A9-like isoform X23 n=1 Tax=Anguilla rostrata TaxID=7938 RepID=UPI0030D1782B